MFEIVNIYKYDTNDINCYVLCIFGCIRITVIKLLPIPALNRFSHFNLGLMNLHEPIENYSVKFCVNPLTSQFNEC